MELVSISSVQPGQVVARAVTGANGAVLCPPGFRLTQAAIERLREAGIDSVVLEGASCDNQWLMERLSELESRFRGIDDPILLQIKATIEKRLQFMLVGRDA